MISQSLSSNKVLDLSSLPLNLRAELLDFYEFLIHKYEQHDLIKKRNHEIAQNLFGKYKHIQTSSELFAQSKQHEKRLER